EKKENILFARLRMMRAAYHQEDYDKVITAAQDALNTERIKEAQEREAQHKLAKAYFQTDRYELALSSYKKLSQDVTSYEGGEARYYVALINHELERDSIAENIVIEFSNDNSPHRYWLAKSFLLLSDIYTGQEAYFQARHILQSLIDNYTNESDGIKLEAQDKLNEIKELEEADDNQEKSRLIRTEPTDSMQNQNTDTEPQIPEDHEDNENTDNENTKEDE
ncbi:MAG: hypothetical protein ACQES1_04870, partial [Bacteroidota bacterium]